MMTRCIIKTLLWWVLKSCNKSFEEFEEMFLRQPNCTCPILTRSQLLMLSNELKQNEKLQLFLITGHCTYWAVCFLWQKGSSQQGFSPQADSRFYKAMCFPRAYSDIATQTYGVIIQPTQIWHLSEFIIVCFAPGAWKALPLSLHRACHRCWCIFLLHGQVLLWKLIQLHDRISRWIIHALHAFCTQGLGRNPYYSINGLSNPL